jgi:hypothetical protein
MIRKFVLAAAAIAALGAASLTLATTPAAAKGWKGFHHNHWHGHHWHGFRFYAPQYVYYDGCIRKVLVKTAFGYRSRLVNVCD